MTSQERQDAADKPRVVHSANPAYPPSRTAGLRPWKPGSSPNPSGRSKEGLPAKTAAIQRHLEAKLETKKGKKTWAERVVDAWVENAAKGDPAARRDLLERLYPVPKDEASKSVVLEGLRLELTSSSGEKASLSMARTQGEAGESFALPSLRDSDGDTPAPESALEPAPQSVLRSDPQPALPLVVESSGVPPSTPSGLCAPSLELVVPGGCEGSGRGEEVSDRLAYVERQGVDSEDGGSASKAAGGAEGVQ